jgi:hypothetical protein
MAFLMEICVDGADLDDSDAQNALNETLLIFQFSLNTIIPVFRYTQHILRQFYRTKWNENLTNKGKYEERKERALPQYINTEFDSITWTEEWEISCRLIG